MSRVIIGVELLLARSWSWRTSTARAGSKGR